MARDFDTLTAYLKRRLLEVVPGDYDFVFQQRGGTILSEGSGPIQNDPERLHKRSTPIRLKISGRLASMLLAADEKELDDLATKLLEVIGHRMHEYSPDPELPRGAMVDPFPIDVDLIDLN